MGREWGGVDSAGTTEEWSRCGRRVRGGGGELQASKSGSSPFFAFFFPLLPHHVSCGRATIACAREGDAAAARSPQLFTTRCGDRREMEEAVRVGASDFRWARQAGRVPAYELPALCDQMCPKQC